MRDFRVAWWTLSGFLPSLILALTGLAIFGTSEPGVTVGLRLTARWAYLFFWLAYTGRALAGMWGPRLVTLARRAREFGLGFAAAMVPHMALIAYLFHISPVFPMSAAKVAFFSTALVLAYLLAVLSFQRAADKLSPTVLRRVRFVSIEYIALAFLRDFVALPKHATLFQQLAYLPFAGLGMVALALRAWSLLRKDPARAQDASTSKRSSA